MKVQQARLEEQLRQQQQMQLAALSQQIAAMLPLNVHRRSLTQTSFIGDVRVCLLCFCGTFITCIVFNFWLFAGGFLL